VKDPRDTIGAALLARSSEAAHAFARVIVPDAQGSAACWGDLADHFDRLLTTDDSRIDAFEGLRAAGDLSALLVFLDLNRTHPVVLGHVWKVAPELPATIQCALVSLDVTAAVPADIGARLHPAARALLADPAARERDHEFYVAQAAALRVFRTRAPQVSEPAPARRTP
jgi:hypothetical protein